MSVSIALEELLDYSDHERRKWRAWLGANPDRLRLRFQPDAKLDTIGALLDHTFLVERRHLARLEGGTPPESTGIPPGDVDGLFDYADLVRADLRRYLVDLDEDEARQTMTVATRAGTRLMTRKDLATHMVLHEIRHLAQIAYAARIAGHAPPGEHDLFYFVGREQ
jgi:uncharacterized damage-inducible protein DinB